MPLMHRNDFATMFGLLDPAVQKVLRAKRQTFVDAVIFGVLADFDRSYSQNKAAIDPTQHRRLQVADKFFLDSNFRAKFVGGEVLPTTEATEGGVIGVTYGVIPDLTVRRWIRGWMSAKRPVDMLTEATFHLAATRDVNENAPLPDKLAAVREKLSPKVAGIIDWQASEVVGEALVRLKFDYNKLNGEQRKLLNFHLRGIGSLGGETDRQKNEELALFENRAIAPIDNALKNLPTEVPMGLAKESALHYFHGMMLLLKRD
jgi:hypothetical protein